MHIDLGPDQEWLASIFDTAKVSHLSTVTLGLAFESLDVGFSGWWRPTSTSARFAGWVSCSASSSCGTVRPKLRPRKSPSPFSISKFWFALVFWLTLGLLSIDSTKNQHKSKFRSQKLWEVSSNWGRFFKKLSSDIAKTDLKSQGSCEHMICLSLWSLALMNCLCYARSFF